MRPRWQAVNFLDSSERKALERSLARSLAKKQVLLPVLHPLAIRAVDDRNEATDVVVCRTPRHLLAVEFQTGKVLWHAAAPLPDEIPEERDEDDGWQGGFGRQGRFRRGGDSTLEQRLWEDSIYGSLSTDGRLVYVIEDLSEMGARNGGTFSIGGRNRWAEEFSHNRLVARRILARGEVAWETGGETGAGEAELSRAFFFRRRLSYTRAGCMRWPKSNARFGWSYSTPRAASSYGSSNFCPRSSASRKSPCDAALEHRRRWRKVSWSVRLRRVPWWPSTWRRDRCCGVTTTKIKSPGGLRPGAFKTCRSATTGSLDAGGRIRRQRSWMGACW